jgi:hypothetical protein
MITKYFNVLSEDLLIDIKKYIEDVSKKYVWGHSGFWDERLTINSCKVMTHVIPPENELFEQIKNSVQNSLDVNFYEIGLEFSVAVYLWGKMTNITLHNDIDYPYNGTIYLNENWDIDDGGVFLWIDNETKEIKYYP